MNEEERNFIKELELLQYQIAHRAMSYYKIEGKDSETANELHKHAHKIKDLIKRWKDE